MGFLGHHLREWFGFLLGCQLFWVENYARRTLEKGNLASCKIKEGRRWWGLRTGTWIQRQGTSGSRSETHYKNALEGHQCGTLMILVLKQTSPKKGSLGDDGCMWGTQRISTLYCLMDIIKLTTQLTIRPLRKTLEDLFIDSILNSIYLPKRTTVLL